MPLVQSGPGTTIRAVKNRVAPMERLLGLSMEVQSQQRRSNCEIQHAAPLLESGSLRLVSGHAADHALIYALLRAANQAPSYEDFVSWLDEPTYEPSNRLLVKQGDRIVGHLHMHVRTAWFDGVKVPSGGVQDLAVLPEFIPTGCEQVLISVAENALRDAQAIVATVRTGRPEPFRAAGWIDVCGQGYSEVGVSDLLAHLSALPPLKLSRQRTPFIRQWRHVELDAVRAVYEEVAARRWGAVHRSESYWQWLIGCNVHSDLIVVAENDGESCGPLSRIVGYVLMHGGQALELFCLPEFTRFAPRLLVRAGQEGIERNCRTLMLHTPAVDPLHKSIIEAGGSWYAEDRAGDTTLLIKLLDPHRWIEAICPILRRRLKLAGLARQADLCFDTGDGMFRMSISHNCSRLIAENAVHADVRCDTPTFAALLLGNLDVANARESGRLATINGEAFRSLTVLFPPAQFWQSPFDSLRL